MSSITPADASAITQAQQSEQLQVAVAKKAQDVVKAEGAAVVQLIQDAASFAPGKLNVFG